MGVRPPRRPFHELLRGFLPRSHRLERRASQARPALPPSHIHRNARRAPDRTRWRNRQALCRLRREGRSEPGQRCSNGNGLDWRLPGHVGSRDRQRPGDHRLVDCGQLESKYGAGHRARLRRTHRRFALDVGSHTLGRTYRADDRCRQRMVDALRRPQRGPGLHPHRQRRSGLLRRHPSRRRQVGQFRRGLARILGQIRVGLPGRPS